MYSASAKQMFVSFTETGTHLKVVWKQDCKMTSTFWWILDPFRISKQKCPVSTWVYGSGVQENKLID